MRKSTALIVSSKGWQFGLNYKNKTMKIQLHIHKTTISVERDTDDLTIDDMFEAFQTLLIGATFHPDTIKEWILRKSIELE